MRENERDREKEKETQRERKKKRQRERRSDTERERGTETERERGRETFYLPYCNLILQNIPFNINKVPTYRTPIRQK